MTVSSSQFVGQQNHLPGDLAMWFFILAELTVFAIFFIAFAVAERLNAPLFASGKSALHLWSGVVNTLALVTSSYFVAQSVDHFKNARRQQSRRAIIAALCCGAVYIAVKSLEYAWLTSQGFHLSTDTFFTLYFFITFFHYMHVLLGMLILVIMWFKLRQRATDPITLAGFESGASYWHMVDLVWLILFPLVYVI